MELETLRQGSCVWWAGRNLGAGDGWRGRMNLGDEGVGNRGEEPSECGESSRGAPRDGSVWNQRVFVELGCRNLADGPDAV